MSHIPDRTFIVPCPPDPPAGAQQALLRRIFEHKAGFHGTVVDDIPIINVDYREYSVNTLFLKAFSQIFLKTGVDWIDSVLDQQGFIRNFKDNMKRMLRTGEYFAVLGVRNGQIFIDRIPEEEVAHAAVMEKTGELALFVFIEPILRTPFDKHISWRRVTLTPESIKVEINPTEDLLDEKAFILSSINPNPYGFVPIVIFKLGTGRRGVPFWALASSVISNIEDIVNDIRLINAYNADPKKWIKTEGDIQNLGEEGFIKLGVNDDIGALVLSVGEGLFRELESNVSILSDMLNIPILSLLQIGKNASGEAIEKRENNLKRMAANLREYIGSQMELMFKMMSAFVASGFVELDFNDPDVGKLLTNQVALAHHTAEEREKAHAIFLSRIGEPVDLTKFIVPDIKWPPLEKIDPAKFEQLVRGLNDAVEGELISKPEGRTILAMNIDALLVAQDLLTTDQNEMASISAGRTN